MAHRSFSFPLSYVEETSRSSPFSVSLSDAAKLNQCESFHVIRKLLANQQNSFCQHHLPLNTVDEASWVLHRDITHALILPILEVYSQAAHLSQSLLGTRNIFDLERAFRGEARGAFSWLQCFIIEEVDWCSSRGCPACIVNYVLQSEPTIRMILVACRLASLLQRPSSTQDEEETLLPPVPLFDFWLSALRNAIDADPFWGPAYREDIESRASRLEHGIQELIKQCCELGGAAMAAKAESVLVSVAEVSCEGILSR